jgi:hypothetical protein
MNWLNRTRTKAQQAPVLVQSVRESPLTCALKIAQSSMPGTM